MQKIPDLPEDPTSSEKLLHFIADQLISLNLRLNNIEKKVCLSSSNEVEQLFSTNETTSLQEEWEEEMIPLQFEAPAIELQPILPGIEYWIDIQTLISNDSFITSILWDHEKNQDLSADSFTQFIARAAQWDTVIKIWDILEERCKAENRCLNAIEKEILQRVLEIHNLIWSHKKAQLEHVEIGSRYDYKTMIRGNATGDSIVLEWLPGLKNAGGGIVKKPVVQTSN